jgi:hypothetical protein
VVDDPTPAAAALQSLKESNVHGAVLALGLGHGGRPAAQTPTAGAAVRPHVRSATASVERLLDAILAGAVRADS